MPKTLYLIDGHAQIYRAYYAPYGNLTSANGEPTRATHAFFQTMVAMMRDRKPDYIAMVLDADESKLRRKQIYPEYKAHRDPTPEDFFPQERRIVSTLEAVRMPTLRLEGYEADDIIATIATRMASDDLHVYMVSRDKDLDQLLSDRIFVYDPFKNEVVTPESLYKAKGWRPEKAVEAQTLVGDSVDNVPGVVGIGPKTAAKLLEKYGSAQAVIEHADELTPKQRENVLAFAPLMDRTRQLVTLQRDVPIELDLAACDPARFEWDAARRIFAELGFRRLPELLPQGAATGTSEQGAFENKTRSTESREPSDAAQEQERFPAASARPNPQTAIEPLAAELAARLRSPDGGEYVLINTPEALDDFCRKLAAQSEFALDTETTSLSAMDCDLVGLSLAWEVGRAYYLPVQCVFGGELSRKLVRERLTPILANPATRKIGHNLKYDLRVLRQAAMPVAGPLFDTMIAAFVVDTNRMSIGLDPLAHALFGHTMIPISDLIGKGKQQLRMDQIPLAQVTEYAAEDADYTWRLRQYYEPLLTPAGVDRLFREMEMPILDVLTEMEFNGVAIDRAFLARMSGEMTKRLATIESEIHRAAGTVFNIDSTKQLAEVLFDKLGLRVVRMTRTARSTDAETLEVLAGETGHPVLKLLLEYREIQKLLSTYVDALPLAVSKRTGRIHTSYSQTAAVTGRLASSDPNLQNIPIRTETGRQIRKAFIAGSAEETLIVADYSQVELRVLAHFCEDEALIRAFQEDRDIHAVVAAEVNGVALEAVTKDMRARAKAVNFGIVYGQTAFGLSQTTGMSRSESQAFIDRYFQKYPGIRRFIDQCVANARRDGVVRTIFGRVRPIENIDSRSQTARNQAERFAVNTVIQGSAADLLKLAMIELHRRIHADSLPLKMLLQVHDELVCEGPKSRAGELSEVLRSIMSGAMTLRVPLKVDVGLGDNWLDAK